MEYYSAIERNSFESVLDPITQSEVSQKEKNKYCIFNAHMKNGTDEHICRAGIEM